MMIDKQPKNKVSVWVLYGAILIGAIQHSDSSGKRNSYQTSFPYVTGNTIRAMCDHTIDTNKLSFNPSSVAPGDTIFVKTDYIVWFFGKVHPFIVHPYILVTHNSDFNIPDMSTTHNTDRKLFKTFTNYLEDNKLLAWFGQNAKTNLHSKLFYMPIGLANRHFRHGNIECVRRIQEKQCEKKHLLYMNFSRSGHASHRNEVYNLFHNKPYCYYQSAKNFESYLTDMAQSKFVLSPPGNGEDCHRTWEALYVGAIPVVETSFLDSMFDGLPVLIIDDWSVITEEFLEQKYQEMSKKEYNMDKLYAPYWLKKIEAIRNTVR